MVRLVIETPETAFLAWLLRQTINYQYKQSDTTYYRRVLNYEEIVSSRPYMNLPPAERWGLPRDEKRVGRAIKVKLKELVEP